MTVQVAYGREYERDTAGTAVPGAARATWWGAIFALALCVATLIASEFMPVSLFTPIATDLRMAEGLAATVMRLVPEADVPRAMVDVAQQGASRGGQKPAAAS